MKKGFLIITQLLISSIVFGQSTISGIVFDNNDEPLPGATIQIDSTLMGTFSDQSGKFSINNVYDESVKLTVKFIGFEDYHLTVPMTNKNTEVTVNLSRAVVMAEECVVSYTRAAPQDPFTHTNIKKEEVEELNLGRDVPYLLGFSPSVVSTSDAGADIGYTGMRIRGVDQSNINTTINGVALNDAESHGVFWVNLPDFASSLNSVQIQRGVGTSTNGSGAFGATVNMLTDHSLKDSASATLNNSFGSFNTIKNTVMVNSGVIDGHWTFTGRLSSIKSDGYIDRASSDLKSYFLSGGYHSANTSITALVFGGKEVTYQSWFGIDSTTLENDRTFNPGGAIYDDNWNVTSFYDNEVDNYQQDHSQLIINQQLSEHLILSLTGHYTYGRGYFESYVQGADLAAYKIIPVQIGDSTITNSDLIQRKWLDNHYYGGILNLQYRKSKYRIHFGGALNRYDGDHFGQVIWSEFAGNSSIRHEYYDNKGIKDDFSAYAKMSYFLTNNLIAFGDLQIRNVQYTIDGEDEDGMLEIEDSFDFVNPKAGLRYTVNSQNSVYGSYAIANREPKRSDYVDSPDRNPQHETLENIEIGHEYASNYFALNTNFYYMNYTNQLVLTGEVNNVGTPIRENIGKSSRTGLEIAANFNYKNKVQLQPNVTYSVNQNEDYRSEESGVVTDHGNTDIVFSPQWISGVKLHYFPIKQVRISIYNKYVGEQYMSNNNIDQSLLDAYNVTDFQFNLFLNPGIMKRIRLTAMINNIFDAEYVSNGYMWGSTPYYYPQATRNYMLALGLEF